MFKMTIEMTRKCKKGRERQVDRVTKENLKKK